MLGTFGLILVFTELVRIGWGPTGLRMNLPDWLALGAHSSRPPLSTFRIAILVTALAVARLLYLLVMRTRIGMLIRAGACDRQMAGALGVNIKLLYTLVFALGAALAGLAGLMAGPILTVQVGMGENILILAFVVIIIGGIGSIRGAFIAAMLVGLVDTFGRAFCPTCCADAELAQRLGGRAGDLVDDDLSADGDRAGRAAEGPVPGTGK